MDLFAIQPYPMVLLSAQRRRARCDLITDVPPGHWLIEDYYDPDPSAPDKTYARRGAFLEKSSFDPLRFGVPPSIVPAADSAQILALIRDLQEEMGMAVIFITHDLGVIAEVCDRVAVMYAGRIVEQADVRPLFAAPQHPYTEALLASLPAVHAQGDTLYTIPGLPPDLSQALPGCPFAPRCTLTEARCTEAPCALQEITPQHYSACILKKIPTQ